MQRPEGRQLQREGRGQGSKGLVPNPREVRGQPRAGWGLEAGHGSALGGLSGPKGTSLSSHLAPLCSPAD